MPEPITRFITFFFLSLFFSTGWAQPVYDRHLAAGSDHGVFVDSDGNVHAWGLIGLPDKARTRIPKPFCLAPNRFSPMRIKLTPLS